jgi:hypothetical protein
MQIILDFDYTIFDTDKFRDAVQKIFLKRGVSAELFTASYEQSKSVSGCWNPDKQVEIFENYVITNTQVIREKLYEAAKKTHLFLYKDVLPFLKKSSKAYEFSILSYGEDKFQHAKINGCRTILKYFSKIIVTQDLDKSKEASELARGKSAILIEDNPYALSAVKKYAPNIITVRINRGAGRYATVASGEGIDYEIRGLEEMDGLVKL